LLVIQVNHLCLPKEYLNLNLNNIYKLVNPLNKLL